VALPFPIGRSSRPIRRAKIDATITGARIFRDMRDRGEDFGDFCWSFTDGHAITSSGRSFPVQTSLSERISKDLKRRGFKFVGPTIVYAWLQAVGIVNDHSLHCFRRDQVAREDPVRRRAQRRR
jgi:DNA-3-methyladenine glycosylase I